MQEAADFILYVFDKDIENVLYDTWKHFRPEKNIGKDKTRYITFEEYKKQCKIQPVRRKKVDSITPEDEQKRLEFAQKYIKPRKEKPKDGRSI